MPVSLGAQVRGPRGELLMARWLGGLLRNAVPATTLSRETIAAWFIRGSGVEVGALNSPLRVPAHARVRYVDVASEAELLRQFPEFGVGEITRPELLTSVESMAGFADESEDFVIANHVLEHTEDPLKAMKSIARVLRPQGIFYFALPDKRHTFDRSRRVTPLAHLVADHRDGPEPSRRWHYEEWIACVDGLGVDEAAAKLAVMLREHSNIHFHVWEVNDMIEWVHHAIRPLGVPLDVELIARIGSEVVFVLRKRDSQ